MELLSFLISFCILLLFYLSWKKYTYIKLLPPGPWGYPIVGKLFSHFNADIHQVFKTYEEKYGKIFSISYGHYYAVVITDYKMISNILKRDEFSGRPHFESWKFRNRGKNTRGVLFSDGNSWLHQRRFALRSLRDFGFGKKSMQEMISFEAQELIKYIKKDLDPIHPKSKNLDLLFSSAVLNSLWMIVVGRRYANDDPYFLKLVGFFTKFLQFALTVNPVHFLPIVKDLTPTNRKKWAHICNFNLEMHQLINAEIEDHKQSYEPGVCRDFIDLYLQEIKNKEGDPSSSFHDTEGLNNLSTTLLDLFIAGVETTSTTLIWTILFLCLNPHVQRKAQMEIDSVVGRNREPCRDDKEKMVYIEAVLSEVHRRSSILPFNVYHRATQDTDFEGYLIPKNAVLIPSMYATHHDPEYWKNPFEFIPERFLNKDGTKFVKNEHLMAFSYGKRVCIGEPLARDTLFLFLTTLLQNFTFALDPKDREIDLKPKSTNINSPNLFHVFITERE